MTLRTKFRIPPTSVLANFEEWTTSGGRVELDNAMFAGDGKWFEYLTLVSKPAIDEATIAAADGVERVSVETIDAASGTRNVLVLVEESSPFVVTTLTGNGAVPHRIYLEDGRMTVVASVQDWTHLKDVADVVEERYSAFELSGTTEVDGIGYPLGSEQLQFTFHGKLTETQLRTLRVAHRMGFFEVPREATAQEVADRLDVSQSALSEKLRRIHQDLCEFLFGRRQQNRRPAER